MDTVSSSLHIPKTLPLLGGLFLNTPAIINNFQNPLLLPVLQVNGDKSRFRMLEHIMYRFLINEIQVLSDISEISIYPNPITDCLTIELKRPNTSAEVSIRDLAGHLLYRTRSHGAQMINFNTGRCAQGMYVVLIQTPDFIVAEKIVVVR